MRTVFFGTPELATPSLAAIARGHEVTAVVCQPDKPQGRSSKPVPPPVKAWAQDRGIARLQAQRRGVGGDVRPRFVNDADHAQRDAHPADLDAGGAALHVADFTDRIGQGGDLFQSQCHGFDALFRERQAVDHRPIEAIGCRLCDVGGIGGEQFAASRADRGGHRHQGSVLRRRRGARRGP